MTVERRSTAAVCILACLALGAAAFAAPLTPEQRIASCAYVQGLQNPDGGFRPNRAPAPSNLGSVPAAVRVLKYFEGRPRDPERTFGFVLSCYDRASGGFADKPGGTPDVRSTAMGLMALSEMGPGKPDQAPQIVAYFEKNAKTPADIYIAAAALHGAGLKTASASQWISAYEATRTPAGVYGKGGPDTARAVNTIVRLGGTIEDREAVVRDLKSIQRPDGGFSAGADAPSDLGTTYPVMRALYLLKEKPDVQQVRAFVATCRNPDGGYGVRPGEASSASATYFAAIVLHWAEQMAPER